VPKDALVASGYETFKALPAIVEGLRARDFTLANLK